MPTCDFFAGSYADARAKFREAAYEARAELDVFEHPTRRGPAGDSLSIDVAFVGSHDAHRCLLLTSGVHGVEGFAGSGCQVGFFKDRLYDLLECNTCALIVHALNPYGFAWLRRVNEDNVDLNRNFQDFSRPLPRNDEYAFLHELLVPKEWNGASRLAADSGIKQYVAIHGSAAFQSAVSAGQYTHQNGMFYGGVAQAWSTQTLRHIVATLVPRTATRLVALDLHTGLGPNGYGEPIFDGGGAREFERAVAFFGPEVVSTGAGNSVSAVVTGSIGSALATWFRGEVTYLAIEFGTKSLADVLTALRGDHWCYATAPFTSSRDEQITQNLRDAFYVETPSWQAAVYGRTVDFIVRAARALAQP